jgi:hypothetical protein
MLPPSVLDHAAAPLTCVLVVLCASAVDAASAATATSHQAGNCVRIALFSLGRTRGAALRHRVRGTDIFHEMRRRSKK